ncbi:hypothetical protein GCM10012288_13940 [Malaciobacter pacificus]|jgi:hypothetical protein|uniref:Uncharacterized protein n=1 Tax=Malaciobacter pacificus TaxID=1080223 RepID=A0A5C2H6W4_9BACT|nr:hypothetical protein [Malaciobacter pacificus]QEP33215.1 hypothetical protein APAC_0044 [Malaciobacter pacificus]GGD41085.1 hypothetical protein GCM10012288_13940 [Malaciobacter pacificus]
MKEIKEFLDKELSDFDNFKFHLEEDGEYIYAIFTLIFGEVSNKELSFKKINDIFYLHSTSFGWKAVLKSNMNKFLWIELLK